MGSLLGVLIIMADLAKQEVMLEAEETAAQEIQVNQEKQENQLTLEYPETQGKPLEPALELPPLPQVAQEEPSTSERKKVSLADIQQRQQLLAQYKQQIELGGKLRQRLEKDLQTSRNYLGSVETALNELKNEYQLLQNDIDKLNGDLDLFDTEFLRQDLAELEKTLADKKQLLEKKQEEQKNNRPGLAVIPHRGQINTMRYPIYIVCKKDGVVLEPEGIKLTDADFAYNLSLGSPLEFALRAKREYLLQQKVFDASVGDQEPYPLILVCPDGIEYYYLTRMAISAYGNDFGYKLVDDQQAADLVFPPRDDQMTEAITDAIRRARMSLQRAVAAAPAAVEDFEASPVAYGVGRAGERQGLNLDQNSRVAEVLKRSSSNSRRNNNIGSNLTGSNTGDSASVNDSVFSGLAAGTQREASSGVGLSVYDQPRGDRMGTPIGFGSAGGSDGVGGLSRSLGSSPTIAYPGPATGVNMGPAGNMGNGGMDAVGSMDGSGDIGSAGNAGEIGNGVSNSEMMIAGSRTPGTGGSVEDLLKTGASPSSGSGTGYGPGYGSSPVSNSGSGTVGSFSDVSTWQKSGGNTLFADANNHGVTAEGINSNSGSFTGNGVLGGTGSSGGNGTSGGSSSLGGNSSSSGGYPANTSAGGTAVNPLLSVPEGAFVQDGTAMAGGTSGESCANGSCPTGISSPATVPADSSLSSQQMRNPEVDFQDVQASQKVWESGQKVEESKWHKALAERLGPNWAVPEARSMPVSMSRPVVVDVYSDRYVVRSARSGGRTQTVPVEGTPEKTVEALIKAVQSETKTWGDPGNHSYWRPFLKTTVQQGGHQNQKLLMKLLENSGVDVQ